MGNKLPVLTSDAFILAVAELMEESNLSTLNLGAARTALSRSPMVPGVMTAHGVLIARLMDSVGQTSKDVDAQLLAAYFRGIIRLGSKLMDDGTNILNCARGTSSYRSKPTYDALNTVMENLGTFEGMGRAHTVLLAMTQQGWMDPNELLLNLSDVKGQMAYLGAARNYEADFTDTAYGAFLYALRPLVVEAQWFPSEPAFVEHMWGVHDGLTMLEQSSREPSEAAFIDALVHNNGELLHHALAFLERKSSLRPALMDGFFPLPLENCLALAVLDHLVRLASDTAGELHRGKAQMFMERLAQHHPQLHCLLQIHVDLFPGPELAQGNVATLIEGFEQLRGRGKAPELAMDGAVFE